ncbi:hypothetical protein BDV29DRAFT_162200 [Aspergillus leporis]|uniref:Glycosyltransferase 2-like domain-containing protein n=1 Tax=Aspergillus leporis TaxID=41062 RepID=A0A5N5WLR0_9EURO|nr:hypothetical protein BDV29DRAFT_162200 [Aspergillus leporis]
MTGRGDTTSCCVQLYEQSRAFRRQVSHEESPSQATRPKVYPLHALRFLPGFPGGTGWLLFSLQVRPGVSSDKVVISFYSTKYKPVPLPEWLNYSRKDVSIIVPTIDTESTFTECMRLWLKANPREIIIATVERNKAVLCSLSSHSGGMFTKSLSGKIFALVDDDVYWRVDTVVNYLLAPFDDAEVGAVAGIQSAKMHESLLPGKQLRRLTCTSGKALGRCTSLRMEAAGASSARTLFIRASTLQDQGFADAYTEEVIGRRIVNTTDDVVLTGLIFDRGWKVSIQNTPQAEVTTNIPQDHKFVWQVLRCDRGNFRTFLGYIFVFPGYRKLMQRHPYTTSKMVERLTRPIWALAYVWA